MRGDHLPKRQLVRQAENDDGIALAETPNLASAGGDGDVLPSIDVERDGRCVDASPAIEAP